MGSRAYRVSALLAVVLLAATIADAAEPSAADRETARQLMAQGRSARASGDEKTALASFRAADDLMHVPTTGLELARSQLSLGLLVEARDSLLRVIRYPVEKGEPAPFAKARSEAAALDERLRARIPSVVIRVTVTPPDAPLVVMIDDDEVPVSALGTPRSVNPGHHRVTARSGQKAVTGEFDVQEGEKRELPLQLEGEPVTAAPSAARPIASPAPVLAPPPARSAAPAPVVTSARRSTSGPGIGPTLVVTGLATTGVGLLLGGLAGGLSLSKTNAAKKDCADVRCPPSTHDDIDAANTFATLSNIGFVIAGAGAGAVITGLIIGSPSRKPPTQGLWIQPYVTLANAGFQGGF